jgi:ADP-dependent NAD(P)H-hydrate dehydratase / NAD(P)H-hydrate epimerase
MNEKQKIITFDTYKDFFKPRPKDSHKGNFGHVLIVGGEEGFTGAVILAAKAALRMGAGLVTVATRKEYISAILSQQAEIMAKGIQTIDDLTKLLERATVIVLGPGLGQTDWSKMLYDTVIVSSLPKVIDADGLNLLALSPTPQNNAVLTPHVGEAARLLGVSPEKIQSNREEAVDQLQKKYGGTIVLKGSGTLIKDQNSDQWKCLYGNPGMATAGMGDVLSGIIGALIAQGLTLTEAACLGVALHGLAGDLAVKVIGEKSLLASDLIDYFPKSILSAAKIVDK